MSVAPFVSLTDVALLERVGDALMRAHEPELAIAVWALCLRLRVPLTRRETAQNGGS